MLHSSFWNHGAAELQLSLWSNLFCDRSIVNQDGKNLKSHADIATGLLDFLSSPRAVKYLWQCPPSRCDRQEGQRLRAGLSRTGQRFYASLASESDKTLEAEAGSITRGSNETRSAEAEPTQTGQDPYTSLEVILNSQRVDDYEEAWRLYGLCDNEQRFQASVRLLTYLSTSTRALDADRCAHLFEGIHEAASAGNFRNAIRAHVLLGDLSRAMQLHQEGLKKYNMQLGSEILLAQLVDTSQWLPAFTIWANSRSDSSTFSYSAWDSVVRLPNIVEKVLELNAFVDSELAKPEDVSMSDIRDFVATLVESVIFEKAREKGPNSTEVTTCVKLLEQWMLNEPSRYEPLINELISRGYDRLAVRFYRRFRRFHGQSPVQISSSLLEKLLKQFCLNHGVLGIKQVLEDFFRYHGRLSRSAYLECINEFAEQGNVTVVKALLMEYCVQDNPETGPRLTYDAADIAPLLHVHATRGELTKVIEIFDNVEKDFGIKPDSNCWNALINAYGKASDVDGAFNAFQKMQESSIRPNTSTFDTLMEIATTRGDFKKTLEFYRLAKSQGIDISTKMVNCLVLGHIQNDQLGEAERLCERALTMNLEAPKTIMWNSLLSAHALRRDMESINRLLHRMNAVGVKYDSFTYSALMLALCRDRQPDRAFKMLKKEMPRAGLRVTALHYAIVMGGFILTGQLEKVFIAYNRMTKKKIRQSTSSRLMVLKARVKAELQSSDPQHVQFAKAEQYMQEIYSMGGVEDIADPHGIGVDRPQLDLAHSVYFEFLISTYGKLNAFGHIKKLYQQYYETIPKERRGEPPLRILVLLMVSNVEEGDYDTVQRYWELAFQQAREHGRPLGASEDSPVLDKHQYSLRNAISVQIESLSRQKRFTEIEKTINDLNAAGFQLDQQNWNIYVQALTKSRQYLQAFKLCESMLMPYWIGWAKVRYVQPVRNRLPHGLRRLKRARDFLRPRLYTLLYLAKAYNDLRDSEAESYDTQLLLVRLRCECPKTVRAIRTMRKQNDPTERAILTGQEPKRVTYV
jgi:pentatricopeptide repeat-containing protein PET309